MKFKLEFYRCSHLNTIPVCKNKGKPGSQHNPPGQRCTTIYHVEQGPHSLWWQKVGCFSHWNGKATNLLSPLQRFTQIWVGTAAVHGGAHFNHCPLTPKAWHSCCLAALTRHSMLNYHSQRTHLRKIDICKDSVEHIQQPMSLAHQARLNTVRFNVTLLVYTRTEPEHKPRQRSKNNK